MFKSARWRSEKNKIESIFKLQFHATQLKQLTGDTLIISIIPADTGKPTTRLEKAKVKDGSCYWEKPHYQTLKFVRDPKNGKFNEKVYHFVMATGSSKSSCVGEVSIDFASFAEATKTTSLSLPLRNGNCAAFLHVLIQRVQESLDQREVDGTENAKRQDRSLRAQLSNDDMEESISSSPNEDHGTLSDNVKRESRASSGSEITLSGSDSSSGLDDTPREPEPKKTKPTHEPLATTIYEERRERASHWDWLDGSPPDMSTDDSSPSPGEPEPELLPGDTSEEGSPDSVIKTLKIELEVLTRQADVSELELQTLQLNYEKDLNSNLRLQLQKTQESNTELILAVQDLDEMLERKDSEMSKSKCCKARELQKVKPETDDDDEDQKALEEIVREHSGMQEGYLLEQKITDLYGEIELYKRDKDELEMQMEQIALDYEILKQGNHDMCCKLEQSQLQEQLKMQYECTSYPVVNELEAQIESLDNELKMKSIELSESVLAIEELETHVKNLEKDLEDQGRGFEADLEDLMNAKVEQEQRAIHAEENLRKMKMQNANTAERLQEEFRRLSAQMTSSFEANDKVALKAMFEANQLRLEKRHLEEKVKQDLDLINVRCEEKLVDLLSQVTQKSTELEKMENQIEYMSAEIETLRADKQNLENERKGLTNEVHLAKMELESSRKEFFELMDANKQKDGNYERLQSEMEALKSRYNDMKLSLIEDESEKEKLRKQISELKCDLKNSKDAISSMEQKIKESSNRVKALEGSKAASRNNRCSSKEVTNLKNMIELLEEKDLMNQIKELERRLEVLDQSIAISQACRGEEIASLKRLNTSMEVELMEMQERYSEISLKFAEVEGERQRLVMTLRSRIKKC
ncbi:EEIG1/EHBP1 N-terminal domain-containing protein [Cynara cardunculus var. scolymus]|uniref:EEIG1/EHBP1 N-terminal domain-containing protein n=1 Tax=Cynara cardunculus var. scolymus TaxID=59895 RepID=A0A103XG68_CYNCS|nr:EEIG1/EHBP1 N-terminal domain-containing protein [Cynara cardunculus var. scolymus]